MDFRDLEIDSLLGFLVDTSSLVLLPQAVLGVVTRVLETLT